MGGAAVLCRGVRGVRGPVPRGIPGDGFGWKERVGDHETNPSQPGEEEEADG